MAAEFEIRVVGDCCRAGRRVVGEPKQAAIIRDRGGAIDGKSRFDFFTGFLDDRDAENPFSKIKLNDKKVKFAYRKITGNEADTIRKNRNFPLVPSSH